LGRRKGEKKSERSDTEENTFRKFVQAERGSAVKECGSAGPTGKSEPGKKKGFANVARLITEGANLSARLEMLRACKRGRLFYPKRKPPGLGERHIKGKSRWR